MLIASYRQMPGSLTIPLPMRAAIRSFAKINLGLYIGATRADGFHELRTVYQTIALHDVIRVTTGRGQGIQIACEDPRVPLDSSNTCYRMAALVLEELGASGSIKIEIEKRLPVQGGMGAASSNAVATMFALERVFKKSLAGEARLRIASQVGSDLPLFVLGGTVLGVGRGEEVYPLAEIAAAPIVVATPEIGVSTPQAFRDWDLLEGDSSTEFRATGRKVASTPPELSGSNTAQLTRFVASDRLLKVGRVLSAWLNGSTYIGLPNTGASARGGSRAGKLLSDLVRTGIENDFERVVFPKYPELRDIKGELERAGASYASLSGSGSTLYGLFRSAAEAAKAAARLRKRGLRAVATTTLTRQQFWRKLTLAG